VFVDRARLRHGVIGCIDVKTFLRFFLNFGHVFNVFNVFLFSKRFYIYLNVFTSTIGCGETRTVGAQSVRAL